MSSGTTTLVCALSIAGLAAAVVHRRIVSSPPPPTNTAPSTTTRRRRPNTTPDLLLVRVHPAARLAQVRTVYRGAVIHSRDFDTLEVIEDALLGVDARGRICFLVDVAADPPAFQVADDPGDAAAAVAAARSARVITLGEGQFICPGFVDGHAHAPQHAFTGTGMDLPLLEWLQKYTFPHESRFCDLEHARKIYDQAVRSHLRNGSTTVSYFATIHTPAAKLLVDIVRERGQRALVGKVNMDRNAPDFYIETTQESLDSTQDFVDYVLGLGDPLVQPVITPRFVPTCTPTLMEGLGRMAQRHGLAVQSHMGETVEECDWVRELHPECDNYADVYVRHGLMPLEVRRKQGTN